MLLLYFKIIDVMIGRTVVTGQKYINKYYLPINHYQNTKLTIIIFSPHETPQINQQFHDPHLNNQIHNDNK